MSPDHEAAIQRIAELVGLPALLRAHEATSATRRARLLRLELEFSKPQPTTTTMTEPEMRQRAADLIDETRQLFDRIQELRDHAAAAAGKAVNIGGANLNRAASAAGQVATELHAWKGMREQFDAR